MLRAQYILTQHGLPPSETDKLTDETLIMQVMEAREELEEAKTAEEVETVRGRNGGIILPVFRDEFLSLMMHCVLSRDAA